MRSEPPFTPVLCELEPDDPAAIVELLRWLTGWRAPVCLVPAGPSTTMFEAPRQGAHPGRHATAVRLELGDELHSDPRAGWVWWPDGEGSAWSREHAGALRPVRAREASRRDPPSETVLVAPTEPVLFRSKVSVPDAPLPTRGRPPPEAGNAARLILAADPAGEPKAQAGQIVRAALWGLPAEITGDRRWRTHLSSQLLAVLDEVLSRPASGWRREHDSIRLRRAAWRWHTGPAVRRVSVVLATRRPDWLRHAFAQLLGQRHRPLELVVAGHGRAVADAARTMVAAHDLGDIDVVVCHRPETVTLGELLNHATERATGDLIVKMDDDDWYGSEHVGDLLQAFDRSGALLVGKPAEFVYLAGLDHTVRRPARGVEAWSAMVAGGALAIRRDDLQDLGGWAPVRRAVDQRLIDTVRGWGEVPYRTHGMGYVLNRHGTGHTWTVDESTFLRLSSPQWAGLARRVAMIDG